MALKSGYKGFKKLLGLKTIRPGTLAVDDAALANTFFPRSEQAVLGARNSLYVPNKTVTDSDIEMVATDSELSITGQNSGSSAIWVTFPNVSVSKGTFKFRVSGLTTSGVTNMQLQTSNGTTLFTVNFEEPEAIGNISANADNYKLFIRIAAGADLSAAKVFPQLLLSSDDLDVNSPYAMTNKELTEKVTPLGTSDNYVTTGSISVPNNTATEIASLTLPAGKYLLSGIYCANAASQEYDVMLNISNGDSPTLGREEIVSGKVTTFAQAGIQLIKYVELGSQRTYKLFVKHNAGDAVTVYPAFRAIRVG